MDQKETQEYLNCKYYRSKLIKSCTVHISVEWCFCVLRSSRSFLWDRRTGPWEERDSAVPGGGKGTLPAARPCPERTSRTPRRLWEEKHRHRATSARATFVAGAFWRPSVPGTVEGNGFDLSTRAEQRLQLFVVQKTVGGDVPQLKTTHATLFRPSAAQHVRAPQQHLGGDNLYRPGKQVKVFQNYTITVVLGSKPFNSLEARSSKMAAWAK